MGRVGSALDNAAIESWHSTLEFELRRLEHFTTRAKARQAVAAWIEDYNHDRRHSALGMLSPVAYEQALRTRTAHQPGQAACPTRSRRIHGGAVLVGVKATPSGWAYGPALTPTADDARIAATGSKSGNQDPPNSSLHGSRGLPPLFEAVSWRTSNTYLTAGSGGGPPPQLPRDPGQPQPLGTRGRVGA